MNWANLVTYLRLLFIPLVVVSYYSALDYANALAATLFTLASLSDWLDGYLARRLGLVTRLGKLLDPAADKILTSAALISLVELGRAPAWIVVIIVAREFAISTLRSVAASNHVVIPASWSGKVKTTAQMIAISLLIFFERLGPFQPLGDVALIVTLIVSVYSGIEYGVLYARRVMEE